MAQTINRSWNQDELPLGIAAAQLFPAPPRVGMVIGTFAAVPYIRLQLEARRRFFPGIPCLVHDDCSHKAAELAELCAQYGCDFEHNSTRQPPCLGDLTAFVGGLMWAKEKNIDLLLKVSRRWIFLQDWPRSLAQLALQSQYATYCSYTTTFNFGFRTECLGMAVAEWGAETFMQSAHSRISAGESVFVEGYMHNFAREFERRNSRWAEDWRRAHPMPDDKNGYALWDAIGTDRCAKTPHLLWHDFAGAEEYFQLSKAWELPYSRKDFEDPNQGAGSKPKDY